MPLACRRAAGSGSAAPVATAGGLRAALTMARPGSTRRPLRSWGGTPDRVLAERLKRSRNSVAIMRRALDIPTIDVRQWNGQERAQVLTAEEVQRRWDAFREQIRGRKGQV